MKIIRPFLDRISVLMSVPITLLHWGSSSYISTSSAVVKILMQIKSISVTNLCPGLGDPIRLWSILEASIK